MAANGQPVPLRPTIGEFMKQQADRLSTDTMRYQDGLLTVLDLNNTVQETAFLMRNLAAKVDKKAKDILWERVEYSARYTARHDALDEQI